MQIFTLCLALSDAFFKKASIVFDLCVLKNVLFSSSRSKALCYRLCSPHLPHLARVSKPKPTLMIFSRGSVKSLVRSAKRPELICGCFWERSVRDLQRLIHYRPSAFGAPVYRSMITISQYLSRSLSLFGKQISPRSAGTYYGASEVSAETSKAPVRVPMLRRKPWPQHWQDLIHRRSHRRQRSYSFSVRGYHGPSAKDRSF